MIILVALVVVVAAALGVFLSRGVPPTTSSAGTSAGQPAVASSSPHKPSAVGLRQSTLTEAIDLPGTVALGTTWPASDVTNAELQSQQLTSHGYVTPCGVLVTLLAGNVAHPFAPNARIQGYEVATGTRLWSDPLPTVTGITAPKPIPNLAPSYTPGCHMVLNMVDSGGTAAHETVVMDLASGAWQAIELSPYASCAAAGNGWLGCWGIGLDGVQPVSLADLSAAPPWIADQILVVTATDTMSEAMTTSAYAQLDGHKLWDYTDRLMQTPWALPTSQGVARGVSEHFAVGGPDPFNSTLIKITDGTTLHMEGGNHIPAETMIYTLDPVNGLTANKLVPAGLPLRLWALPLPDYGPFQWTFATAGKMYVAASDVVTGVVQVTPLETT